MSRQRYDVFFASCGTVDAARTLMSEGHSMDRIKITGGAKLTGEIAISGAKNAALPLLIASLLTADRLTLKNVPNLADVNMLTRILRNHGVDLAVDGKRATPGPHLGETFPPFRSRYRRYDSAV